MADKYSNRQNQLVRGLDAPSCSYCLQGEA
jgi:hypothetical protein